MVTSGMGSEGFELTTVMKLAFQSEPLPNDQFVPEASPEACELYLNISHLEVIILEQFDRLGALLEAHTSSHLSGMNETAW